MVDRPSHSPLGASSAERWMECPGSVGLLKNLEIAAPSDEPDYRVEGTAAHAALEKCLRENLDAWEVVGHKFGKVTVNVEMADAIQVFLDTVRPSLQCVDGAEESGDKVYVEHGIDNPAFHPLFYGTVDLGIVFGVHDEDDNLVRTLEVNDFKYGQGIVVEVWHNKQIMYYAYGLLVMHPEVTKVRLRIIQPRGFHPDGPVREWFVDADVIRQWAEGTLKPAMLRTATDATLNPGPHCRFCPAKLACPVMVSLFNAAATADPKAASDMSDPGLDAQYPLISAVKFYLKALEEETYNRQVHGKLFVHSKLVHKKANRVYKPGAREVLEVALGKENLYDPPDFKSPAEVEKLGGPAKKLVHEWAYTPESGLTIAETSDKRVAVKVPTSSETFAAFLQSQGVIPS